MVTAARGMGREGPITLLVLGNGVAPSPRTPRCFADQVLVADKPELAQYDPEVWASAVAQIAKQGEAHTVLIGGSRSGREYSPRVAVKLDAPLIEDAISLADRNGVPGRRALHLSLPGDRDRRSGRSGHRGNDKAGGVCRSPAPKRCGRAIRCRARAAPAPPDRHWQNCREERTHLPDRCGSGRLRWSRRGQP